MEVSNTSNDCISNGDGVILCKGSSLKFVTARPDRKERMENFNFYLNDMIGKPFGSAFKVNGKRLMEIDPKLVDNHDEDDEEVKLEKDNRAIIDDCSAQKMSRDDIMKLKEAGKDGEEIVERIMDSSKTFKEKNVYSKAKYVKKKKKKHLAHFITRKPSARLLCQLFFKKAAAKTLEIRPDTLAQMLTWSNIHSGSKVLVVETCQGLLLGSILERLGNDGQIVQGYPGNFPVRIILNQFNFNQKIKSDLICGFSLERLEVIKENLGKDMTVDGNLVNKSAEEDGSSKKGITAPEDVSDVPEQDAINGQHTIDAEMESNVSKEDVDAQKEGKDVLTERLQVGNNLQKEDDVEEMDVPDASDVPVPKDEQQKAFDMTKEPGVVQKDDNMQEKEDNAQRSADDGEKDGAPQRDGIIPCSAFYTKETQKIEEDRASVYLQQKLDSLIIASKFHPKDLLIELIGFIKPSSPIIIYCQFREPLMECYEYLRDNSLAVNVVITETWFRDIQVLPNRTHPEITMSARGGYLLRGIKVKTDDASKAQDDEPCVKKPKTE